MAAPRARAGCGGRESARGGGCAPAGLLPGRCAQRARCARLRGWPALPPRRAAGSAKCPPPSLACLPRERCVSISEAAPELRPRGPLRLPPPPGTSVRRVSLFLGGHRVGRHVEGRVLRYMSRQGLSQSTFFTRMRNRSKLHLKGEKRKVIAFALYHRCRSGRRRQ